MQIYSAKFCDGKSNIVFSILEYISFESSLYLYLGFIYECIKCSVRNKLSFCGMGQIRAFLRNGSIQFLLFYSFDCRLSGTYVRVFV